LTLLHALLSAPALVVCLCAQWCGSCREYASRFEQVARNFPGTIFLWIDIEDEADLVDPVDAENFPTLLIALGDQAVFFGPLAPTAQTLERLLHTFLGDKAAPPLADRDLHDLVARIRKSHHCTA
jgi:thioredoxin 1